MHGRNGCKHASRSGHNFALKLSFKICLCNKICDGARVGRAVSARYFMPDERWTRSSRSRLLDDSASIEALTLQMSELWTWQLRQAPHHRHHGNTQRTAAGWQATHMQDPDTIHAEEQQNNPNAVEAETAARVQPVVVVQQLRAGGFTAKQLKDNGFSSAELRAGGFTSVPDDTPLPAPASVRATGDTAAVDEADADGAPWPPRPPLPPPPLLSQAG